jgi:septum formation protein
MKLILASSSKYRQAMLSRLTNDFTVIAPGLDESHLPGESPLQIALRLSLEKAKAVAGNAQGQDWVIIGSDQTATVDGTSTIGKPHTHAAAMTQLQKASGNRMMFHSGLAVLRPSTGFQEAVSIDTTVEFRTLTDDEINRYLLKEQPYDCTGSAKIESLGIALVNKVQCDDPTALVGLPLIALSQMLARAGLKLL